MFKAFTCKAPAPSAHYRLNRAEKLRTTVPQSVATCVIVLLIAVSVVVICVKMNEQSHKSGNLRKNLERLKTEIAEADKSISDREIVLEQLKDGTKILRQARLLGLRLPGSGQLMHSMQVVSRRSEDKTRLEKQVAGNVPQDWSFAQHQ